MRAILVLLLVAEIQGANRSLDKLVEAAMDVLAKAKLDATVRECSCAEDGDCVKDMERQAMECATGCWKSLSEIIPNAHTLDGLHSCILTKVPVVGTFIRCLSENLDSCVKSGDGPQIPKVDLRKMFNEGEQQILSARAEMINSGPVPSLRPIGEAVLKFGGCMKKCFVEEKNADGFCYEKKSCQPLITEQKLRRSLRMCIGSSSWKSHASDLCECAIKAGVEGLNGVCSFLKAARPHG